MASDRLRNRWGIVVAAVCIQVCLGAAYGWSVFKNPLMNTEHWSETAVQLNYSLTFICVGFGTIIGGLCADRIGPRLVSSAAGILYGMGYIVAGLSAAHHYLNGLYLGYGLLAGTGMGMGYICAVSTLVKWFPDKRGLMTGVAVCGFGFGALIMSPIAAWEIINYGVPATFETLGVVYLIVIFVGAQVFAIPPHGWHPAGWQPRTTVAKAAATHDFTVAEAARTWQFYLLFLMQFTNIMAGFTLISQASPMAQEMVGMTVLRAAGMVGLISIFNGLGRIFWASASDYLGRARVYFLIFLIELAMLLLLPRVHDWTLFSIVFATIGLCYGGGLGTTPSFTADYFGTKALGGIYGFIMFGANFAGTAGPIMIARVHQSLGKYPPAINVIAITVLCGLVLPLVARRPAKRQETASAPAVASTD
jgi:OFA family oxalate/formate antiporter-like MFS transporter